jgi:hypothetical protein
MPVAHDSAAEGAPVLASLRHSLVLGDCSAIRQSAAATPRPDGEPISRSSESYCGANGFLNPPARVGALGG